MASSRRRDKTLVALKPEMEFAVRAAKGDGTADMAVEDAKNEEFEGKNMYTQAFEVGKKYFIETAVWVYLGEVEFVGTDYLVITKASRLLVDGHHHVMQETGTATGIELEMSGRKGDHQVRIPLDWVGCTWEWVHPLPTVSTGS